MLLSAEDSLHFGFGFRFTPCLFGNLLLRR
jgi:hypothetical protein